MQQTEKYKLNLIESSDPFLPDGLNANTQKIEDVLAEKMEGPVTDLAQRVTALEAHRFFVGTYTGTGVNGAFIELGFTPIAIFVSTYSPERFYFACTGSNNGTGLSVAENGIRVGMFGSSAQLNNAGTVYIFLAFV